MSLVPCKECGTEISTKAASCPKCGARPARQWGGSNPVGVVVAAVVLALVVYSVMKTAIPPMKPHCTMNGLGAGSCTFTNSNPFPWKTCGKIVLSRGPTQISQTGEFCSGFVGGNSTATVAFGVENVLDGCKTELPKLWSNVCDFSFETSP